MPETPRLHFKLKKALLFCALWLLFFGLSIAARLPHYLSKNFFFDGDEALIGIMAQDLLEGKHFPMYFYGQNYGFSMFEACSTALFIKLLGSGIWALRLGGLLIFSLGATFIFQTAKNRNAGMLLSFLVTLLVLCFPAWYLWGGMVRGGYVTAFTLCCALFYLLHGTSFSNAKLVIMALLSAFAFESHVLILIPFAPFLLFYLLKQEKPWLKMASMVFLFGIFVALIRLAGYIIARWPQPELAFGLKSQAENFVMQTHGLLSGYANFFFFTEMFAIPSWWQLLLCLSLLIITAVIVRDIYKSSRFRRYFYLCLGIALLAYCFLISAVSFPTPRYWIGFYTGLLFVLAFIFITRTSSRFATSGLIALVLIFIAGTASGSKMKDHWAETNVNEMKALEGLNAEVVKSKAKAVFIADNLIQYQWNYLYGKKIPASAFRSEERTNVFNRKAIRIYEESHSDVVIAGLWGICLKMDTIRGFNDHVRQVETKYFIQPDAAPAYIEQGRKTMRGE